MPQGGSRTVVLTLRHARERAQFDAVARALCLTDNNISSAAQLLEVSRPTLYDLMRNMNVTNKESE